MDAVMSMKVTELLKEVGLDYSNTKASIEGIISTIKDLINNIPDEKVSASAASGFINDLAVPPEKVEFIFKKPEYIQVGGSYAIKSSFNFGTNVDLLLQMPKDCFHEKDYLNYRYHAKRCLYLCVIERHLKKSAAIQTMKWSSFQNEARKPVLLVYPVLKPSGTSDFFIRIIPTATKLFNIMKLNLSRNNLPVLSEAITLSSPQGTGKYNSSILEDMFLEENTTFVMKAFDSWKYLEDALLLLKIWARNRSSIYMHDCINGFLISIIMSYLTTKSGGNRIKKSMSTMQIFRVTLDFIATSKFWDKGIFIEPPAQLHLSREHRSLFLPENGIVICDSSGYFNLAFRMTKTALLELQMEAALALNCIDKCDDAWFEEIFMTKVDFPAKFDYCMRINFKGNAKVHALGFCLDDECWRISEAKVCSILEQGLSDRAKLVRVSWQNIPSEWDIVKGFSLFGEKPLLAGIIISSSEKSLRMVDIGPNAENKEEVKKFRTFWGGKAELRRFKDGTIAESTVWTCEQWERHLIVKRISEYLLSRHLSLMEKDIVCIADQLDFCLSCGTKDPLSYCGSLFEAYEVLSKRLRQLDDIPLLVSSVQPLDAAFRYTAVYPPQPHSLALENYRNKISQTYVKTCIRPLKIMIQLEGSGNWPLDKVALQKTKSAFLLKIGESLESRWGMTCIAAEDDVNVLMSGYAFHLSILHEKALSLSSKTQDVAHKRVDFIDKELFIRGQHASMINGLQGRYPTYSAVVRLAKRWVSSHLFSAFLVEEAVELLVAYLFLKSLPFAEPFSRITGFLRFLRLLSEYDWAFSPLIIDINNDFDEKDVKEINDCFCSTKEESSTEIQRVDKAMFLATAYDKKSEAWTRYSPDTSVLKRLVSYARSSRDFLTKLITGEHTGLQTWESLFRTPLSNYGAVVLLHNDVLSDSNQLLFSAEVTQCKLVIQGRKSKDFQPYMLIGNGSENYEEAKRKLMVNFNPMRSFVEDLKREFPDKFKIWYDSLGGDAIGLTWENSESKKRGLKEEDEELIDALKVVGTVGKGLVRSIHIVPHKKIKK